MWTLQISRFPVKRKIGSARRWRHLNKPFSLPFSAYSNSPSGGGRLMTISCYQLLTSFQQSSMTLMAFRGRNWTTSLAVGGTIELLIESFVLLSPSDIPLMAIVSLPYLRELFFLSFGFVLCAIWILEKIWETLQYEFNRTLRLILMSLTEDCCSSIWVYDKITQVFDVNLWQDCEKLQFEFNRTLRLNMS